MAAVLLLSAAAAGAQPVLTVRAMATLADGVGPTMIVRVGGAVVGAVEVRAERMTNYNFSAAALKNGASVDVVFTNANGGSRKLHLADLTDGVRTVVPTRPDVRYDRGSGAAAFDGEDLVEAQNSMVWSGALRFIWPPFTALPRPTSAQKQAVRLLLQGGFGPTPAEAVRVAEMTPAAWIDEQMAMRFTPDYQSMVQRWYDLGDAYRPEGARYDPSWLQQRFWRNAITAPDQLRRRVGFALHHIFMVSLGDSNLWAQARAYGRHLDMLNGHAFGSYRSLIEELALSPVTGIFLSHLGNRREEPAAGTLPDENFARELMQLFSIGLVELNIDGSPKLGTDGQPIPTYGNDDVMALARVFTGWGWGYDDAGLTDKNFLWGSPSLTVANDRGIDLRRMRAYPGRHSLAEKRLFTGKPWALTIPANTPAEQSLAMALDGLARHPNVGPYLARRLIQHLVTSQPSPGYVARVARAFNNNGAGVRGDLGAVVRAVLLDSEARSNNPPAGFGKLREPVLRVAHWARAMQASSASGDFRINYDTDDLAQRPYRAPTVFGYFRPGYVPPNTAFSTTGTVAPEFQIVNEATTASWVNLVQAMVGTGIGLMATPGGPRDVTATLLPQMNMSATGDSEGLIAHLNLLLFAGNMSAGLRQAMLDAMGGVAGGDAASHLNRARVALMVAMASPEYLVQR